MRYKCVIVNYINKFTDKVENTARILKQGSASHDIRNLKIYDVNLNDDVFSNACI